MPRSSHRRSSLSSGSEDESNTDRRHAPNRGRRAASMHLSTRPAIESHGSYHRASSERRHHSPEYSSSDSDSDDGYRRRRRRSRDDDHSHGRPDQHSRLSRQPSRQPSRASSRRSTPSPPRHRRHRSVDVHDDHHRGRDHSPSSHTTGHGGRPAMRRRPSSAEPAPSSSRSRRDKGYYPPSASHTPKGSGGSRHNTWPLPQSMGDKLSDMHPPRPVGRHSDMLLSAGRTAFTAGAMAALKLKDDPTPWMGAKGAKVVAAGLSAACVDTFMESKHPKRKGGLAHTMLRQATNFAIGGLVVRPVEKGKIHMPHHNHVPTRRRSTRSGGGMEGGGRKSSRGSPDGGERRRR